MRFSPLAGSTARQQVMDKYGIKALFHLRAADTYVMAVPQGADPQSLVTALKAEAAIKDAGLDGTQEACFIPNDPYFTNGAQWWLGAPSGGHHDDMPAAWDRTLGSGSIFLAILDTGTDFYHPDLQPKLIPNGSGG